MKKEFDFARVPEIIYRVIISGNTSSVSSTSPFIEIKIPRGLYDSIDFQKLVDVGCTVCVSANVDCDYYGKVQNPK